MDIRNFFKKRGKKDEKERREEENLAGEDSDIEFSAPQSEKVDDIAPSEAGNATVDDSKLL